MSASFAEKAIPPSDATVMVALGFEFADSPSGYSFFSEKDDRTMKLIAYL